MYYSLDDDGDVLTARPTPLVEVLPQMGFERHCGSGFELVLDVTVPQLVVNWWKCRTSCLKSSSRTLTFQFVVVGSVPKFLVEVFMVYAQDKVYRRFRQRQWWSILHPRLLCFLRLFQWWSMLPPLQR